MRQGQNNSLITAFLTLALMCSACGVVSDHPVAALSESEPVPEELLGTWQAVQAAGLDLEPGSGMEVIIEQQAGGSVGITLIGDGGVEEIDASLAVLGGRLILSFMPTSDESGWFLASLVHDEVANTITVEILGHAAVISDIELGRVEGEVYSIDNRASAHLTDSTAGLRDYIELHGQAFDNPLVVLARPTEPQS